MPPPPSSRPSAPSSHPPSSSRPTRPNPDPASGPIASPAALTAGSTPYASSEPVSSSSPLAAGSSPYESLREELPADELTAVFSPSPELLARSGRQSHPGSAWEEPTQVVHVSDVLGAALESASEPAPPHTAPSASPTPEELNFERQLRALATPVPAPKSGRRWLWWAIAAVLAGAAIAALAEYWLHPPRRSGPSSKSASVAAEPR
jgi:hypothetical protein